ncbi:serine dehydratase alpha chain domain protein [Streptococcus pyogenes GA03799]|nr:serine dehydratase alpha chain domain protein [Streptococcus pyogenes GA41208]ESA49715.1 serine dehydratase alpha chain domain protein [Streptococcus pyogenes GA40468]ESA51901.1 serine dehydratase alpha chain domain protein [Streptococcus pyogenes GA40056]ESU86443.1 serine dehydratase alpha chain domain protein [Streptococcus pyogenes GA03799]ESU94748.1 serine dehydratase alpha chain domain protein [Streptococcus pyogenes GA03747]ESU96006.1 serine dehydratase alpha chain domain protein [Str
MFYTIEELVKQADQQFNGNIAELMIATEVEMSGRNREDIIKIMSRNLQVMKAAVTEGLTSTKSISGLTGGDAVKMDNYIKKGNSLSDTTILNAVRNAIAVNELNAKMGLVCATPTAGSAGCLPAVLATAIEKLDLSEKNN